MIHDEGRIERGDPVISSAGPQATNGSENGTTPGGADDDIDLDEWTYNPVPPRSTRVITVVVRRGGKLKPLPYPLER